MTAHPRVLVVGSGGREHALVCALHDSPEHPAIFAAPGNPGMEPEATLVPIRATDLPSLCAWVDREKPDLVVIGPDASIAAGLADELQKRSIPVLGPVRAAGRLESSKSFAKQMMQELKLPTAPYRLAHSASEAKRILAGATYPIVLKADGLAAGKGVVVAETEREAMDVIASWMERGELGESGRTLVVEEFLRGEEASLLVLTDGERWMLFPAARDHKRAYDGDKGPNTGGMGACAPALEPHPEDALAIARRIVDPILGALREQGTPYRGVLYLGLMLTPSGPMVLEINARFGDPEAQVVLPLLDEDVLPLFLAAAKGSLPAERHGSFLRHAGAAVCVVLAAAGYPKEPRTGQSIEGLSHTRPHGIRFYCAGVDRHAGRLVTSGGRVVGVTARAETLKRAREAAYEAVSWIRFDGMHYRRDIASALQTGRSGP
ncbi:MAG TPA: phosphoribosylamine--glycine ligase [Candidatus Dormibacteraeota bacterium]|nr:phosphoribosylamine--glycine ligase [Candidatus Dormibacteraeota bacterium]